MTQRNTFEWDNDNEDHIAKHGVDRYEAMEASEDSMAFIKRVGDDRYGNPRYVYVGKTEDGRILFMVVDRKGQGRFRIGSARDAALKEKKSYRRRSKG